MSFNRETKAFGSIRRYKGYGACGVILGLAALSIAMNTGVVSADELKANEPKSEVSGEVKESTIKNETPTGNASTNLSEAAGSISENQKADLGSEGKVTGEVPVTIDHTEVQEEAKKAEEVGVNVVQDKTKVAPTTATAEDTAKAVKSISAEETKKAEELKSTATAHSTATSQWLEQKDSTVAFNHDLDQAHLKAVESYNGFIKTLDEDTAAVVARYKDAIIQVSEKIQDTADGTTIEGYQAYVRSLAEQQGLNKDAIKEYLVKKADYNQKLATYSETVVHNLSNSARIEAENTAKSQSVDAENTRLSTSAKAENERRSNSVKAIENNNTAKSNSAKAENERRSNSAKAENTRLSNSAKAENERLRKSATSVDAENKRLSETVKAENEVAAKYNRETMESRGLAYTGDMKKDTATVNAYNESQKRANSNLQASKITNRVTSNQPNSYFSGTEPTTGKTGLDWANNLRTTIKGVSNAENAQGVSLHWTNNRTTVQIISGGSIKDFEAAVRDGSAADDTFNIRPKYAITFTNPPKTVNNIKVYEMTFRIKNVGETSNNRPLDAIVTATAYANEAQAKVGKAYFTLGTNPGAALNYDYRNALVFRANHKIVFAGTDKAINGTYSGMIADVDYSQTSTIAVDGKITTYNPAGSDLTYIPEIKGYRSGSAAADNLKSAPQGVYLFTGTGTTVEYLHGSANLTADVLIRNKFTAYTDYIGKYTEFALFGEVLRIPSKITSTISLKPMKEFTPKPSTPTVVTYTPVTYKPVDFQPDPKPRFDPVDYTPAKYTPTPYIPEKLVEAPKEPHLDLIKLTAPRDPEFHKIPREPKVPTVHYHLTSLNENTPVEKEVRNEENVSINGESVAKNSTNYFILKPKALPAGRPITTSMVLSDYMAKGIELDIAGMQKANKSWDISYNNSTRLLEVKGVEAEYAKANADRTVPYTPTPFTIIYKVLNDGASYENVFKFDINGGAEGKDPKGKNPNGYTSYSNKVKIYTPGSPENPNDHDNPNGKRNHKIQPTKNNTNKQGKNINGKELLQSDVNYYVAEWDLDQYIKDKSSKSAIAKGFAYIDNYQENAVTPIVKEYYAVTSKGGKVEGLDFYEVDSTKMSELPEKVQALIKDSGIDVSKFGKFQIWVAKDSQAFYDKYVKTGTDIFFHMPMSVNIGFNGKYENQTYQIDFGNGYYGNVVKNNVPNLTPKKDVVVDSTSVDNQTINYGQEFDYLLKGAKLPSNRGSHLWEVRFLDDYDEKGDKYLGYQTIASTNITVTTLEEVKADTKATEEVTLEDGTVIKVGEVIRKGSKVRRTHTYKVGDDLTKFTDSVLDEKNGVITVSFKEEFLKTVEDSSEFGADVKLHMKRIAYGEFENTYVNRINGVDYVSNTVKTNTPEPPKPEEPKKPQLPNTGETETAAASIAGYGLLALASLSLLGTAKRKDSEE